MPGVAVKIKEIDAGVSADIGAVTDSADHDPSSGTGTVLARLAGILEQLQGDGSGAAPTTLATQLSSEYDTLDVNKMSHGGVELAYHDGITASVAVGSCDEIDTQAHNAVRVEFIVDSGSGTWDLKLSGSCQTGGTFIDLSYDGLLVEKKGLTANWSDIWPCPGVNYVKVVPTEIADGATITINVTPVVVPPGFTLAPKVETTHHSAATGAANGTTVDVPKQAGRLFLHTTGTSTSRTIQFKASEDGTNYTSVTGVNLATMATGTSTTGIDETWMFEIPGLTFMADLTAVAGGNVTVTSTAVS